MTVTNETNYQVSDSRAERAMLSSVWLSGDSLGLLSQLERNDFIDPLHQWLLKVLQETKEAGEPLDAVAVMRRSSAEKANAPVGTRENVAYRLANILRSQCTSAHQGYYFRALREERWKRAVRLLLFHTEKKLDHGVPVAEIVEYMTENLTHLTSRLPKQEGTEG